MNLPPQPRPYVGPSIDKCSFSGAIGRWRAERGRRQAEQREREHRWDELGGYNARVAYGIVHTPEYIEYMAEEQRRFNEEHDYPDGWHIFPIRLEPRP